MGKIEKSAASIGIIGGADGPTAVFTAGRKIPLKQRIRRAWFDFKRRQVAKRIKPEPHTMEEVMKYRNYKNIVNTQSAAKPMVATDINLFDAQENYLNTPEATYDLKKGLDGARAHNSTDLLTKITNAAPGDEGRDLWEAALQLFFCGDQELITYVQETVGLAAIGKVYQEFMIIAYGCGANGKSTFWNTVSRVLGTYSGAISADALTAGCRRNVKHRLQKRMRESQQLMQELMQQTQKNF